MESSHVTHVKADPLHRAYREAIIKLLDMTKTEMFVLAGDIIPYRFYDIRTKVQEVLNRGVKVTVCAYNPSIDLRNRFITDGGVLYIAEEEPEERFMIVDGKHLFINHPKEKCVGDLYLNDDEIGLLYKNKFSDYVKDLKPASKVPWGKGRDPLLLLLKQQ